MPSRLGPRFAIEALFLVAVAVGVGVADLSTEGLVVVMAGAWLLTVASVPITTIFRFLVAAAAASAPGSTTPITGT